MTHVRDRIVRFAGLLLVLMTCLTAFTCNKKTARVLVDSTQADCGEHKIFLSSFYNSVEDKSQIAIDPIGGYLFLYWVDEDGNCCHGDPGVSGQPGPFVVSAFLPEAYSAAVNNRILGAEQLQAFQEIPFSVDNYSASGIHFVQFDNTVWRSREDGQALQNKMLHYFSTPGIVSLDLEFCFFPVYANGEHRCTNHSGMLLPNLVGGPNQHPSICRTRALPTSISMSWEERLNYCVLSLPHGLEIYE